VDGLKRLVIKGRFQQKQLVSENWPWMLWTCGG
jgi:hypothetical protein